jgi:protein phosphatase
MLICPKCQTENSEDNNFCTNCGAFFIDEKGGAITGNIFSVLINKTSVADSPNIDDMNTIPDLNIQADSDQYLDSDRRYRLLSPILPINNYRSISKVLDTKPLQTSPLQVISEYKPESVPNIVKIYARLEKDSNINLPKVHDAWLTDDQEILILEDRSNWQTFADVCSNNQVEMIQILFCLGKTLSIWEQLTEVKCRNSVLDIHNLLLDEDQNLSLKQLELDTEDQEFNLKKLGDLWYKLLAQSSRTQFADLVTLIKDLRSGVIDEIAVVKESLKDIYNQLQPDETAEHTEIDHDDDDTEEESALELDLSSPTIPLAMGNSQKTILQSDSEDDDNSPTVVLPMQLLSLEEIGITDIGRMRTGNEDYFAIEIENKKHEEPKLKTLEAKGLYVLCDGMGGHAGGEVASKMAVETICQYFQEHWTDEIPPEQTIKEAILLANKNIYDVNQQSLRTGSARMGTTLVMVLIQGTKIAIASVGDSRVYRVTRKHGLEQLTIDHEVGQREIQRGVEPSIAYSRPDAYQLTQALGPRDQQFVIPDVKFLEMNEETLLVLCSDGLSDNDLLEDNWQTHLSPLLSSRANLEQGVQQLIEFANQHNGHDNITCIAIRVKLRPNMEKKLF